MRLANIFLVSLHRYNSYYGAKLNKFIETTKLWINFFIRKINSKSYMAENKRIKILVHWLISQGVVSSQQDLGDRVGVTNKSYLSQLVNGKATSTDFLNKLTKLDERINRDWIENGSGEMIITDKGSGQQFNGPITGDGQQFAGHDFNINHPCNFGVEIDKIVSAMTAQADLTKEAHEITRRAQDQVDRAQAQVDKAQTQMDRLLAMLELKLNITPATV